MNASKLPPESHDSDPVGDAAERLAEIVRAAERAAASVIDDAEKQAQQRIDEAQARADELDPPAAEETERPMLRTVEAAPEPAEPEPSGSRRAGEAGARLLATQMAVSGASRKEIENQLRAGAGIEDPASLLDAILGPEE